MQEQESIKKLFKELDKNKNNEQKARNLLAKINSHLLDKSFRFNQENTSMLYPYLYASNKYKETDYLNQELTKEAFINLLDSTKISGSMLLSLTSNCHKPRLTLLTYSKKIKNSLLKSDELLSLSEIINDLTPEEITFLRRDSAIDNLLIKKGLSFSTLKSESKKHILEDLSILKLYNLNTIEEFTYSCPNPEELINNETFLNIYLSKLDNNYQKNHPLLNLLSIDKLESILNLHPKDSVIIQLLINTNSLFQKEILKLNNIDNLISNNKSEQLLRSLPYTYLKKILINEKNLFSSPVVDVLYDLSLDKLKDLAKNNKYYYKELIKKLNKVTFNPEKFITSLTEQDLYDLKNNVLPNLDIVSITNLCKIDNSFKKRLLCNKDLCTTLVNSLNRKEYYLLDNLFALANFNEDDKVLFISNIKKFKDSELLNRLLASIPLSKRKFFYDNDELRTVLVSNTSFKLDEYAISYYLNNTNEIPNLSAPLIKELLLKTDLNFNNLVLSDSKVIDIIFVFAQTDYHIIPDIIKNRPSLIKYFNKESKYYTKELLSNIMQELDYNSKKALCSNDLIKYLLKDKYYNIYRKLLNANAFLLNTIDFRIFEDYICDIKISILSYLTKYPSLEQSLITISKNYRITSSFINTLYYSLEELNREETLDNILSLLALATNPKNRKKYGNLSKILAQVNYSNLSKSKFNNIISYYLYMIPRFYQNNLSLKRPNILNVPRTYEEVLSYETNTVTKLTNLIKNDHNIKEYFVEKHFKLTLEEAKLILKMYDFSYLDTNTYNEEYIFISNLNRIMNTDNESLKALDNEYQVISMYDSFRIINNINKMYSKTYNYELRSKNNNLKSMKVNFYNQEITIYNSKEDFLYLVANLDLESSYLTTKNYFNSYHTLVNDLNYSIPCSLLTKDNLVFHKDFLLGYNGLLDEGITKMSNYYIKDEKDNSKDYFASVPNLINNTRDYNNTIYLNKYALRPNYNNDNLPNIEPDYMLVDANRLNDNMYLNKIVTISLEFKNKHHPEGLPIISLDLKQISKKELTNINKLIKEYTTTYEPVILSKILTKLENNYTAYRHTNKEEALKYDIYVLLSIVINRLNNTNSIFELNEIEEIFTKEYQKYELLSADNKCNFYLENLKKSITTRKNFLNNY